MSQSHYDASRSFDPDEDLRIVKISQLAKELNVSTRTIHRRIKSGKLPKPIKTAGGYNEGWFRTELTKWKQSQTGC